MLNDGRVWHAIESAEGCDEGLGAAVLEVRTLPSPSFLPSPSLPFPLSRLLSSLSLSLSTSLLSCREGRASTEHGTCDRRQEELYLKRRMKHSAGPVAGELLVDTRQFALVFLE